MSILLCITLLFYSSSLSSQSNIPSLYVGEITSRDGESASLSPKIRSQIVVSIVKNHKGKYNILDDELVKQLSEKIAKMQKQGCDDTECRRALDLAIDWDEKIVGEISKEGDKFSLILKVYKMNKETYQPGVKSSQYESFYPYQLDFYVKEMSRALMDLNYSPDYSRAPKKEGEKVEDKPLIDWNFNKVFFGNLVFPGYNRIARDDSSGYVLGSVWTLSLIGIAASYPKYSSARSSYESSSPNTILYPLIFPPGSETLGSLYAINQKNSFYEDAITHGRRVNAFGILALGVWSYSWMYGDRTSNQGQIKIPGSDWYVSLSILNRSERMIPGTSENQTIFQLSKEWE